jgi:Flp pilus assembly protein TadD
MRGTTLAFLALLAACSPRGSTGLGSGPPGLDVADAALRGGSPEIALQISGGILATDPNNEAALLTQGEALTALQRLDQAEVSFSKALAANPTSVGAHIGLGRIRLGSDPAAAEALFLEAIKREPRNGVALNDLGIARDLQGRHTDAQEAYRQALGVNPDMTAAQVNLALSLAMTGKSQDAVQLLRPLATRPEASPQLRHDFAAVLAMGGDRVEAERILSKDLPPNEVQLALGAYASGGPGAAGSLLTPSDAPAATPVRATPSGTMVVQLAATPTEDAAQAEWRHLQERHPDLLSGHQPMVLRVERDGKVFWRLRTGGFADNSEASAFCERVRAAGTACVAVQ